MLTRQGGNNEKPDSMPRSCRRGDVLLELPVDLPHHLPALLLVGLLRLRLERRRHLRVAVTVVVAQRAAGIALEQRDVRVVDRADHSQPDGGRLLAALRQELHYPDQQHLQRLALRGHLARPLTCGPLRLRRTPASAGYHGELSIAARRPRTTPWRCGRSVKPLGSGLRSSLDNFRRAGDIRSVPTYPIQYDWGLGNHGRLPPSWAENGERWIGVSNPHGRLPPRWAENGERWIRVSNAPPIPPMRTVSPAPAGRKRPNNGGLFAQSS